MEIKEIEEKINKKIIEYKHQKIDHIKLSRFFQKLYKNGWYKLSITINKPEIGILIDKVAGFEFEKAANEHNRNPKEIDSPESIIDWYYNKFIIKKK